MTNKIRRLHPMEVIDYPKFVGGEHSGLQSKKRRGPKPETAWTRATMEMHAEWHDVVGIEPFTRYELQYAIRPLLPPPAKRVSAGESAMLGLPKVDAVGYHDDGRITIVEAKLESSAVEMLRGMAQLLYYKTLMQSLEHARVAHLVLASPSWPAYLIDVIDEYKLPVRLLRITEDQINGAIPTHLQDASP